MSENRESQRERERERKREIDRQAGREKSTTHLTCWLVKRVGMVLVTSLAMDSALTPSLSALPRVL